MDFKSEVKSGIYSEEDGVRHISPSSSRAAVAEAEVVPFHPYNECCFSVAAAKMSLWWQWSTMLEASWK